MNNLTITPIRVRPHASILLTDTAFALALAATVIGSTWLLTMLQAVLGQSE